MFSKVLNPYAVLGLPENAAAEEIRKAYRLLALRCHPDKSPPDQKQAAEEVFKDLGGAYDILKDPQKRRAYDLARRAKPPRGQRRSGSCDSTPASRFGRRAPSRWFSSQPKEDWDNVGPTSTASGCSMPPTMPAGCHTPPNSNPSATRVWFARGSAVVGRAYKGQEVGDLASTRMKAMQLFAEWANGNPAALIDIRGCALKEEIGPRQREALGLARCDHAVSFLTNKCGVAAGQCYGARRLGDDFQGIELRAMLRLQVSGAFEGGTSNELSCGSSLGEVASVARAANKKLLMVEVSYTGAERLAQRRVAALRRSLAALGVPIHKMSGRVRAGSVDEAAFLVYEELAPLDES